MTIPSSRSTTVTAHGTSKTATVAQACPLPMVASATRLSTSTRMAWWISSIRVSMWVGHSKPKKLCFWPSTTVTVLSPWKKMPRSQKSIPPSKTTNGTNKYRIPQSLSPTITKTATRTCWYSLRMKTRGNVPYGYSRTWRATILNGLPTHSFLNLANPLFPNAPAAYPSAISTTTDGRTLYPPDGETVMKN